jgi:TonB-dependent SusC/RagA subfamily outer membrane receptor
MTTRRGHPLVRTIALAALGAGLVAVACEAPRPTGLKPSARVPLNAIKSASPEMPSRDGGGALSIETVRGAMTQHMPDVLNGATHARTVWFVSDATGKVVNAAIEASDTRGSEVTVRAPNMRIRAGSAELRVKNGVIAGPSGPAFMNTLDPKSIATVDVMKLAAGQLTPDSVGVIWIVLRAPGEAEKLRAGEMSVRTEGDPTANPAAHGGVARFRATIVPTTDESAKAGTSTTPNGGPRKTAAAEPIYYVDGQLVPAGPDGKPALPAPDRIESVNVLKGQTAVDRYGESAVNGVVLITTKKN